MIRAMEERQVKQIHNLLKILIKHLVCGIYIYTLKCVIGTTLWSSELRTLKMKLQFNAINVLIGDE